MSKNGRINVCKYLTRKLSGQISDYELMPGYQKICRFDMCRARSNFRMGVRVNVRKRTNQMLDYLSGSMPECMSEDV